MKYAFVLIAALLAGCSMEPSSVTNQCMRVELFKQCMAALPAGPVSTQYNDWDDVVDACELAALKQSIRSPKFVPAECR